LKQKKDKKFLVKLAFYEVKIDENLNSFDRKTVIKALKKHYLVDYEWSYLKNAKEEKMNFY